MNAPPTARLLSRARAALVIFGGPLALLAATVAAAGGAARSARAGRLPRPHAAAMLGAAGAYVAALPRLRNWGATRKERGRALAGDETVPRCSVQHTRAVTIAASGEQVWPWLVQIGQDRAGFYSYTWLENLAGCRMVNADRIHPEWQEREVGEIVLLHHETGIEVAAVDPGRSRRCSSAGTSCSSPTGRTAAACSRAGVFHRGRSDSPSRC